MRVALGCDHAGFPLKDEVRAVIESLGHECVDCGTNSTQSVDYPDFAAAVAREVRSERVRRGVIICGSGVGACVAANKIRGVRACVCHDVYSAAQGVEHDDMNVLCLGGRIIGPALIESLVTAFLEAEFSGEVRHQRRLDKVRALESETSDSSSEAT